MATLVKAWVFLLMLTLAAMWAGTAQDRFLPAIVQIGVIASVSIIKASTILHSFLGLRNASSGWRTLFLIYLVLLGGAIVAIYGVGYSLAHAPHPISSTRGSHD